MTTGDVQISILDGGASVVVPGASVQAIIGPCSSGTAAQVTATKNVNTLVSVYGYGPMPEAAALTILAGGTVLAVKAASNTAGFVRGTDIAPITITTASNASPILVTTSTSHGFATGNVVTQAGVTTNTAANGTFVITVLTATTYTLNGSTGTGAGTGGTAQLTGVTQLGAGTTVTTITGAPFDDYYVKGKIVAGGTVGTTGITFALSGDAGRTFGPTYSLGTALTFLIPNTGLTLTFVTAKTFVAGDTFQFSTVAPAWNAAGVQACLTALQSSPYALAGWGSLHIVGVMSQANATTFQANLDTMATGYVFSRAMTSARDASPAQVWGGTGETETVWTAAVVADYAPGSAKRICPNAGYYNTPTGIPNAAFGAPRYRRPLAYSLAARQVQIPPQRHAGRVRDGALSNIIIDPTSDAQDGFVYHDERQNPGFDVARITSARTRIGYQGFYIANPNLLSPTGSVFTLLPLGNVMDIACGIVHQTGQLVINADLRVNPNGTIYENEAKAIENTILGAIKDQMIATGEISGCTVVVDRTNNILTTNIVNVAVTITTRGYVLEADVSIGFSTVGAAGS